MFPHPFEALAYTGLLKDFEPKQHGTIGKILRTSDVHRSGTMNKKIDIQHDPLDVVGLMESNEIKDRDLYIKGHLSDKGRDFVKKNETIDPLTGRGNGIGFSLSMETDYLEGKSLSDYTDILGGSITLLPRLQKCVLKTEYSEDKPTRIQEIQTLGILKMTDTGGSKPDTGTPTNAPPQDKTVVPPPKQGEAMDIDKEPPKENKEGAKKPTSTDQLYNTFKASTPEGQFEMFTKLSESALQYKKELDQNFADKKAGILDQFEQVKDYIPGYDKKNIEKALDNGQDVTSWLKTAEFAKEKVGGKRKDAPTQDNQSQQGNQEGQQGKSNGVPNKLKTGQETYTSQDVMSLLFAPTPKINNFKGYGKKQDNYSEDKKKEDKKEDKTELTPEQQVQKRFSTIFEQEKALEKYLSTQHMSEADVLSNFYKSGGY